MWEMQPLGGISRYIVHVPKLQKKSVLHGITMSYRFFTPQVFSIVRLVHSVMSQCTGISWHVPMDLWPAVTWLGLAMPGDLCHKGCDRLAGDPVDSDVVSFTSAIGAVQWPVAIELMISMEEKGGP